MKADYVQRQTTLSLQCIEINAAFGNSGSRDLRMCVIVISRVTGDEKSNLTINKSIQEQQRK